MNLRTPLPHFQLVVGVRPDGTRTEPVLQRLCREQAHDAVGRLLPAPEFWHDVPTVTYPIGDADDMLPREGWQDANARSPSLCRTVIVCVELRGENWVRSGRVGEDLHWEIDGDTPPGARVIRWRELPELPS